MTIQGGIDRFVEAMAFAVTAFSNLRGYLVENNMQNVPSLFLLILILTGCLGLVALIAGLRLQQTSPSIRITLISALPALTMLVLFYSLAIHMHRSLRGWPTSIGNRGFPSPLITHADIALQYFGILILISIFVWPVAFVLCALIRRFRGALFSLGVYALSCSVCFIGMSLAPPQFLYWWWD